MKNYKLMPFGRILGIVVVLVLAVLCNAANARDDAGRHSLTVMTQNMDAGTDFKYLFGVPDPFPTLLHAATATYVDLLQSHIPERALLLARTIARQKPDLVSLQEVTRWEAASAGQTNRVLYDQLSLLLNALDKFGQHYRVAVSQDLSHNELPVLPALMGLVNDSVTKVGFTDRDVILVRSDHEGQNVTVFHPRKRLYSALLELPAPFGITFRGWLSVDVKTHGRTVRYVNTHLETVIPVSQQLEDYTKAIQVAQANELIQIMDTSNVPVILAGDFNADAEFAGIGPDQTETPNKILDAGYLDAWHERYPLKHGYTWPLFLEDPVATSPIGPFERIDLIYSRGLEILDVHRLGARLRHVPSDHAGLLATFKF